MLRPYVTTALRRGLTRAHATDPGSAPPACSRTRAATQSRPASRQGPCSPARGGPAARPPPPPAGRRRAGRGARRPLPPASRRGGGGPLRRGAPPRQTAPPPFPPPQNPPGGRARVFDPPILRL